jgi:hypothetical protein
MLATDNLSMGRETEVGVIEVHHEADRPSDDDERDTREKRRSAEELLDFQLA